MSEFRARRLSLLADETAEHLARGSRHLVGTQVSSGWLGQVEPSISMHSAIRVAHRWTSRNSISFQATAKFLSFRPYSAVQKHTCITNGHHHAPTCVVRQPATHATFNEQKRALPRACVIALPVVCRQHRLRLLPPEVGLDVTCV